MISLEQFSDRFVGSDYYIENPRPRIGNRIDRLFEKYNLRFLSKLWIAIKLIVQYQISNSFILFHGDKSSRKESSRIL